MSRRDERSTDADAARPWFARDARALAEAQRLAAGYVGGRTLRALATESGRSYGYVHRRVKALTEMRPAHRPSQRGRIEQARGAARARWGKDSQ